MQSSIWFTCLPLVALRLQSIIGFLRLGAKTILGHRINLTPLCGLTVSMSDGHDVILGLFIDPCSGVGMVCVAGGGGGIRRLPSFR